MKHFVNVTKKLKLKQIKTKTNELSLSAVLDKYKDVYCVVFNISDMSH